MGNSFKHFATHSKMFIDIINPYKTAGCLLFADKEGCPSTMTRTSTTLDKYFCPLHDSLWKSYCRCYCGASPVAFRLIKYVDIWWVGVKIYPMYTSDIDMYTSDIACIHVTNSENILKIFEKSLSWKSLNNSEKSLSWKSPPPIFGALGGSFSGPWTVSQI